MTMHEPVWLDVGALDDIPLRGARVVRTAQADIALFRTRDGAVFALEDRCPHKRGPLSQGIVHDRAVTCPLHNWVIALDTGEVRGPDRGCVRTFATRVHNGRISLSAATLAPGTE